MRRPSRDVDGVTRTGDQLAESRCFSVASYCEGTHMGYLIAIIVIAVALYLRWRFVAPPKH